MKKIETKTDLTCPICGSLKLERLRTPFNVMDGNTVLCCSADIKHKFQRNSRHPIESWWHNEDAHQTNFDFSGRYFELQFNGTWIEYKTNVRQPQFGLSKDMNHSW